MTSSTDPGDEPTPQTEPSPETQEVENVNGEVIDSPTVNAYVVGVSLLGPGDPQTAAAEG